MVKFGPLFHWLLVLFFQFCKVDKDGNTMQGCNDCSFDYDGNLWVTAPAGEIAPKPYRRSFEVITIYLIYLI